MRIYSSIFLLLFPTIIFTSCHREGVYDPDQAKTNVADLTIPSDFNWNMSEDMELTLTCPVKTTVSVFADASCKTLLADLPIGPEESTYNINIPVNTTNIYVQYTKADDTKAILPIAVVSTRSNGFHGGSTSQGAVSHLPEDQGAIKEDVLGEYTCYYPSKGWGTLLFEDMWPETGDYDFNDLAAYYKIELLELSDNKKKTNVVRIAVRLHALGGYLPYQLCLQTLGIHAKEIEEVVHYSGDESCYQLENAGEAQPAIFSFHWKDKKGSNGGKYYNTEKDYLVPSEELAANQISFILYLGKDKNIKNQLKHESFDFYLRKNDQDKTEIHLRGYKPTPKFMSKYNEIVREHPALSPSTYYCTNNNLVWGMKVNAGIAHTIEQTDFTKAYTKFGAWLKSGGKDFTDWYLTSKVYDNCVEVD